MRISVKRNQTTDPGFMGEEEVRPEKHKSTTSLHTLNKYLGYSKDKWKTKPGERVEEAQNTSGQGEK